MLPCSWRARAGSWFHGGRLGSLISRALARCSIHSDNPVQSALVDRPIQQAVVALTKGRAAAQADCAEAWAALPPGGRLLVVGANSAGIKSIQRMISSTLAQARRLPIVPRARGHVAA